MSAWDEIEDWTAEMAVDLHNRIDRRLLSSGPSGTLMQVARTAVELHAPNVDRWNPSRDDPRCVSCVDAYGRSEDYPCRETVAIATVVGVPPTDGPPPPLTGRAAWQPPHLFVPRWGNGAAPGRD